MEDEESFYENIELISELEIMYCSDIREMNLENVLQRLGEIYYNMKKACYPLFQKIVIVLCKIVGN